MKTSTYNSWWREMGAISRGMMFIEGSIATPITLDPLQKNLRTAGTAQRPSPRQPRPAEQEKNSFSLYQDLLFLGGRPMTAGHNDDIDEPFPQLQGDRLAAPRKSRDSESNRGGGTLQPETCATC